MKKTYLYPKHWFALTAYEVTKLASDSEQLRSEAKKKWLDWTKSLSFTSGAGTFSNTALLKITTK